MPGIRERIVDAIYKIGHMGIPEKRLMTTFDQELMDIDSISSVSSHSGFAFKFWNSHKS